VNNAGIYEVVALDGITRKCVTSSSNSPALGMITTKEAVKLSGGGLAASSNIGPVSADFTAELGHLYGTKVPWMQLQLCGKEVGAAQVRVNSIIRA